MKAVGAWLGWLPVVLALGVVFVTDRNVPPDVLEKQWVWLGLTGLAVAAFLLLWVVVKPGLLSVFPRVLIWTLIGFGVIEAGWGLCQVFGLCASNHSLFVLTGTFYNPGPYSGYLAVVFPIVLHEALGFRLQEGEGWMRTALRYGVYGAVMLLLCVLPAGMSRAAWLATGAGTLYVLAAHWGGKWPVCGIRFRKVLVAGGLAGMVLAGAVLYLLKKDSADGRMFIWKVALTEAPACRESGWRTFSSLYGEAQERYFARGGYTEVEERVAGTPDFAFNEYVQLAAEGRWGLLLMVLVVGLVLLVDGFKKRSGLGGGMLAWMVFAFFSYPFHIPGLVAAVLGMGLALAIGCISEKKYGSVCRMAVIGMAVAVTGWMVYKTHQGRAEAAAAWSRVRMLYHAGAYESAAKAYGNLKEQMDWNGDFWFEYGRSLYKLHRTVEAEEALTKALAYSGDPMILNVLGRNAQGAEDYEEAERYYWRAVHRLPGRIYPYYLLVKLYAEKDFYQPDKLYRAAKSVLGKEPKVNSEAVRQMRDEVRKIIKCK